MLYAYALKSTVILLAAALLAVVCRRRSAAIRHLVWTSAAAALVVLPLLTWLLPALRVPVASGSPAVFRVLAQARAGDSGIATAGATDLTGHAGQQPATVRRPTSGLPWLAAIWAAGSLLAICRLMAAWLMIWRLRRTARPSPAATRGAALAKSLGIRHPVRILETTQGSMPMTCGILRPAVLLPAGSAGWSAERLRVVLLHELAHVLRGDVATHLLARLAFSLAWWNPLAWFAWRQIVKEGERATDDLVLAAGERASDYAGQLLEIARGFQPRPAAAWAALAMARSSHLEGRLDAILDSRVNRRAAGRTAPLAAVVAAIAVAAPFAAVQAQDVAMPPETQILLRSATDQNNYQMLDQAEAKYEQLRQFDVTQKLLESALAIRGQVHGDRSAEYATGLVRLGNLAARLVRPQQAQKYYEQAVSLGDRPKVSPALLYLGLAAYTSGNIAQADDLFQRLVNADPNGPQTGPALTWLAGIRQRQQGRESEAEPLYQRAMSLETPGSYEQKATMAAYASFLSKQGRVEEAQAMRERALQVPPAAAQAGDLRFRGATGTGPVPPAPAPPAGSGPTLTPPGVYRVGHGISAPKLIAKVEPSYDEGDRAAGVAGTVVLSVEIEPDGRAHNAVVVRGLTPGLDQKALDAITQWQFQPGMKDGAPVTVLATIEVNFRLM